MIAATLQFFNLMVALIAVYFAIRILPSISYDIHKRSWLFLSLGAITFSVAQFFGVLREIGNLNVHVLHEFTEAVFVVLLSIGFFYLYTSEHRETIKLRYQSTTDDLTSLYTHGFFQSWLAKKISASKAAGDLSMLFIDIDNFKDYNDRFGHQEGDYVLQRVAETIMAEARDDDIASRYGGEEFTLVLNCNFDTACRVAERLRSVVEKKCSVMSDPNMKRNVTVSIGLSSLGRDGGCGEKLVSVADARMYMAKRRGRNQVYAGAVYPTDRESTETGDALSEPVALQELGKK